MSQPEFPSNLPTGQGYSPWHYNPITVHISDSVGAIFLGITCIGLLILLLKERKARRAAQNDI